MIFCALDLEMNQPSNEIIQIGVAFVHLDCNQEFGDIHFVEPWFISPSEPITDKIAELTGITNEVMFENSSGDRKVDFDQFLDQFHTKCDYYATKYDDKVHREPIVWGQGDLPLLRQQLFGHGFTFHHVWGRRAIDVKSLIQFEQMVRGRKPGNLSLRTACSKFGVRVDVAHDAAHDAVNTLEVFVGLMQERQAQVKAIETVQGLRSSA